VANDIAIKVDGVEKTFRLPHERQSSLKGIFINAFRGKRSYEKQRVLKNISFEIKKGEFFGIVGRNGSGKSTLLKLLAGIYTPDKGNIHINGKLTPFIELGVGFNPELTGRENVFLNGALLGFNRKEMQAMYSEIVDFAELHKFMDQKLKNYSSGMQVRLAFSIAIRANSDILVLDEVLAVGDANFQRKCYDIFKQFRAEGRTVVLVTHDMGAVEQYCTRALLLENGKISFTGEPNKVTKMYNQSNIVEIDNQTEVSASRRIGSKKRIIISDIWLEKEAKKTRALTPKDDVIVNIKILAAEEIKSPVVGITIMDQIGKPLFATNTQVKKLSLHMKDKQEKIVQFKVKNVFSDGNYYIVPAITDEITDERYDSIEEGFRFSVSGWEYPAFVVQPDYTIKIN
jgi:ABC-2 type transport system ATP-binding protein